MPPPHKDIERWADVLCLDPLEREEFLVAGWIDCAPKPLAAWIDRNHITVRARTAEPTNAYRVDDQIATLQAQIATLTARLEQIRAIAQESTDAKPRPPTDA